MIINCKRCSTPVYKKPVDIKRNKNNFCSNDCLKAFRKANSNAVKLNCKHCGTIFKKQLSELAGNNFCSRSCSTSYNNIHGNGSRKYGPSKKVFCYCKICSIEIDYRRIYCEEHRPTKADVKRTLADLKTTSGYKSNHFSMVRENARKTAKKAGILNECFICGYNKFVQACHIKQISSFNDDSKIEDINAIDNLIGLCPNHHYELDKDKMSKEDLEKIMTKCVSELILNSVK